MNARERMRGLIIDARMTMIMDAYDAALAEAYVEGQLAAQQRTAEVLRDNFAAATLNGLLAASYGNSIDHEKHRKLIAARAYEVADAMLIARNEPKPIADSEPKNGAKHDG